MKENVKNKGNQKNRKTNWNQIMRQKSREMKKTILSLTLEVIESSVLEINKEITQIYELSLIIHWKIENVGYMIIEIKR